MFLFFFTLQLYSPAGQVITGDVNIVNNDDLKSLILKVQNLGNFDLSTGILISYRHIMSSVEEYARRWAKHKREDLDTSERTKSDRCLIKSRIKRLKRNMKIIYPCLFDNLEE